MLSQLKEKIKFFQYGLAYKSYDLDLHMLIIVIVISFLTIWSFYKNVPWKFDLLSILILIALMGIYHQLPIEKLVQNSFWVSITCVAIIYFGVHIFWEITRDIKKIDIIKSKNFNIYTFNFKETYLSRFNELIFLGANSNYLFFYDKKRNKSYIIPKNKIVFIETK